MNDGRLDDTVIKAPSLSAMVDVVFFEANGLRFEFIRWRAADCGGTTAAAFGGIKAFFTILQTPARRTGRR